MDSIFGRLMNECTFELIPCIHLIRMYLKGNVKRKSRSYTIIIIDQLQKEKGAYMYTYTINSSAKYTITRIFYFQTRPSFENVLLIMIHTCIICRSDHCDNYTIPICIGSVQFLLIKYSICAEFHENRPRIDVKLLFYAMNTAKKFILNSRQPRPYHTSIR